MIETAPPPNPDLLPDQCQDLQANLENGDQFIFKNASAWPWLLIVFYIVFFMTPTIFIY